MHCRTAVTLRERTCALMGAISDDGDANAFAQQTLERQFGDVAGTEHHCPSTGKRAKDFFGELNRRRADRRRTAADAGLFASARAREQGALEHAIEYRTGLRSRLFPRLFH